MSDTAGSRSDGFVDQLLLEAGMDDDGQLRPALLELRALADTVPEPSAAIAALMVPAEEAAGALPGPAAAAGPAPTAALDEVPRVDELAARRRAKRRIALTTFSVAVSLSAGGAVAAASDQGIRESFTQLNQIITSFVTGTGAAPAGHQAEEPAPLLPAGTEPAGTAPAGTAPGGPASIPADPAAATQPAAHPPSNAPGAPEPAAGQPTSPGKPGEVPAPETLPGAVPGHIANGLGKPQELPVPSQVPLPGTLPAVPLP